MNISDLAYGLGTSSMPLIMWWLEQRALCVWAGVPGSSIVSRENIGVEVVGSNITRDFCRKNRQSESVSWRNSMQINKHKQLKSGIAEFDERWTMNASTGEEKPRREHTVGHDHDHIQKIPESKTSLHELSWRVNQNRKFQKLKCIMDHM